MGVPSEVDVEGVFGVEAGMGVDVTLPPQAATIKAVATDKSPNAQRRPKSCLLQLVHFYRINRRIVT